MLQASGETDACSTFNFKMSSMHLPKINEERNWDVIAAFIRQYPFATLVHVLEGKPLATHLPLELVEKTPGTFVLQGHVSKANPQWRAFAESPALVIFTEPHAYISASWYEQDKIPTWNYIAVHITGRTTVLDETATHLSLERLMQRYESGRENEARIGDMPEDDYKKNLSGIVGFEISLDEVQARYKLSQNKNDKDYASVVTHLERSEDQQERAIAAAMRSKRDCPFH